MVTDFAIKPGYQENPTPAFFLDDVTQERGIVFQPDVYTLAELLAHITGTDRIIDVGCGWGGKLAAIHDRHPQWKFVGVDYDANIARCRDLYGWGVWLELDLERDQDLRAYAGAVVICADVIEHLTDPRPLLRTLRHMGANVLLLSTPERDVQHGANHQGPPPNLCHMREWNAVELHAFLTAEGMNVRHLGLTRGHDQSWIMPTQIAICT